MGMELNGGKPAEVSQSAADEIRERVLRLSEEMVQLRAKTVNKLEKLAHETPLDEEGVLKSKDMPEYFAQIKGLLLTMQRELRYMSHFIDNVDV